ncbi:nitrogen assimilation transcription factor nira [Fusarium albosuccineum]|uniref:Nitrogen assimilation transcription factor nira n=1 Tax=Fusarium albosuccineum TaxID=1237068 RepID=A0A8H4NX91_9HYPO|nr:nitrogen assimilation transcription factor nira [Fusarium albosuccineum]
MIAVALVGYVDRKRRGDECVYLQDARRTAIRIRKEDVRALQKQVEELKEQMREKAIQTPSHEASHNRPETQAQTTHMHYPVDDTTSSRTFTPSTSTYPPTSVRSLLSEDTPPSSHRGLSSHSPILTSSAAAAVLASLDRAEPAVDHQLLSPEPTQGGDENEGDSLQLYGATSLLHDQSSGTLLANPPREGSEECAPSKEAVRDRLVSNAAIRRQEETALYSSPSITSKIDFDGVPMDTAMHLLDLHWNRQHLSYLLTYRPAIMDSLIHNGPYVNKLLLNAIYFQSSLYSDRTSLLRQDPQDPQTMGMAFYERFKTLLVDHVDKPTIPTVVALLTCGACLVPRGKQSAGWVFCGIAYRMITDLGCHLDIQPTSQAKTSEAGVGFKLTTIDVEMRRRVYWAAYIGDKLQSLFLGRPPAMTDTPGGVPDEYLDTYEEMEEWKPYVDPEAHPFDPNVPAYRGRPCYAISTFRCLLQLCRIISRIIEAFYTSNSATLPNTSTESHKAILIQKRREIREQLRKYKDSIPAWLQFEPGVDPTPPPHQITPHAFYWASVILTEQAFLNSGRSSFAPEPSPFESSAQEESRQKCIEAALRIWKLVEAYKKIFTLRRAQYGISYATYCAVLVILQHTDQDCDEYIECIRFFWQALLEFQRGCNYGLKRPLRLLKSLMGRIERVTKSINMDATTAPANCPDLSAFQADMDSLFGTGAVGQAGDAWSCPWLDAGAQDGLLTDNTLFGIADDSFLGTYM